MEPPRGWLQGWIVFLSVCDDAAHAAFTATEGADCTFSWGEVTTDFVFQDGAFAVGDADFDRDATADAAGNGAEVFEAFNRLGQVTEFSGCLAEFDGNFDGLDAQAVFFVASDEGACRGGDWGWVWVLAADGTEEGIRHAVGDRCAQELVWAWTGVPAVWGRFIQDHGGVAACEVGFELESFNLGQGDWVGSVFAHDALLICSGFSL